MKTHKTPKELSALCQKREREKQRPNLQVTSTKEQFKEQIIAVFVKLF